MSSIIPGYEYDIFISYRQKDNKYDGWVTEFVENLIKELEATFKEEISVYFDINPHDGLLETHDVDESLKDKLKCLVFIPIISRTYCDPKSFAWRNEFKAFIEQASQDEFGLKVILPNGNVANRVLPVQIHDLDEEDSKLCESALEGKLRGIEFIYKSIGINRPLRSAEDKPKENLNNTVYRDQINKVALAIREIISAIYKDSDRSDTGIVTGRTAETNEREKQKKPERPVKLTGKPKRRIFISAGIMLTVVIIILSVIFTDIFNGGKQAKAESIESVVVLPFVNYTGADDLETLVSGMHACLVSDISRLSGLRVINTTTSNVYKNAGKSVHEIALELNVEAAIEVSVLGILDSIMIQVSLIQALPEEKTIWIRDYKEEKSQVLNLYNIITKQIADEVKIKLTDNEERMLNTTRTVNPDALIAYMKGKFHWERLGDEDLDSAIYYFQLSIDKEPGWAAPYAGMAMSWYVIGGFAFGPLAESYAKAEEYFKKALELDPNSANSHYIKACTAVWSDWDWEEGEKEFLTSLELDPNDALCRVYYAHLLMLLRRTDEAFYQAKMAIALDPLRPLVLGLAGTLMNMAGDYESGMALAQKALTIDPDNNFALAGLADAHLATGDTISWYKYERPRYYWTTEEYLYSLDSIFHTGGYLAVIRDRIRVNEEVYSKGGAISFMGQALRYLEVKDYERAMDYYEKAYDQSVGNMAYISLLKISHPEIEDNPRYIALVKKMNLPYK